MVRVIMVWFVGLLLPYTLDSPAQRWTAADRMAKKVHRALLTFLEQK